MSNSILQQNLTQKKISPVSFFADLLLAGMVLGPSLAPFLAASNVFVLQIISNIIYFIGDHVCPQPETGLELAPPYIMTVCMRCYGTVTGLLITRVLYGLTQGKGVFWLHQYGWMGASVATILMTAYPWELAAEVFGLWEFNNYVVTPFGLVTGLAWGLFAMPLLHSSKRTFLINQ